MEQYDENEEPDDTTITIPNVCAALADTKDKSGECVLSFPLACRRISCTDFRAKAFRPFIRGAKGLARRMNPLLHMSQVLQAGLDELHELQGMIRESLVLESEYMLSTCLSFILTWDHICRSKKTVDYLRLLFQHLVWMIGGTTLLDLLAELDLDQFDTFATLVRLSFLPIIFLTSFRVHICGFPSN